MRKLALMFAFLFTLALTTTSCRETKDTADDVEDVVDDVEDAVD
ncbi:hypothetical protein [Winogradskyella sp.]